jgi:hypothetical protein
MKASLKILLRGVRERRGSAAIMIRCAKTILSPHVTLLASHRAIEEYNVSPSATPYHILVIPSRCQFIAGTILLCHYVDWREALDAPHVRLPLCTWISPSPRDWIVLPVPRFLHLSAFHHSHSVHPASARDSNGLMKLIRPAFRLYPLSTANRPS